MPPYQRKGKWYADFRYTDPQGVRRRCRRALGSFIKSLRAARRAENELRAELETARHRAAMGIKEERPPAYLSGLADQWLEVIVEPHKKPNTHRKYESVVRVHLLPHFGDVLVSSIHRRDIDAFIAHLHKAGKSPNTINTILSALSGLMKTAVSWGYLEKSPCEGMVWGKPVVSEEFIWFNAEQTEAFLTAAERHAPKMWRLFFLGFRTGLRPGELLAARQGDLDLVGGSIWVQRTATKDGVNLPKGNRKRRVALSRETVMVLKTTRHLNGDLLCPTPDGEMWTHRAMTWRWEQCLKAAGLPRCGPHTMRHSYASQLVSAGVPLYAVQRFLGHSRPTETQRYAHLAPESQARWVQALDRPQRSGHKEAAGHNLDTSHTTTPESSASTPQKLINVKKKHILFGAGLTLEIAKVYRELYRMPFLLSPAAQPPVRR